MVGVPGRSKACNTCKQRKISCSLERPECRTCIKANRECTGYQRERIFLLDQRTPGDGLKSYRKPAVPQFQRQRIIGKQKFHLPTERKDSRVKMQAIEFSSEQAALSIVGVSGTAVYRHQIMASFVNLSLPNGARSHVGNWISMIPTLPDMTKALEDSMMAICTMSLGRIYNDPALKRKSSEFYVQGLWELQRALWSPGLMHRDETCAACLLLVLYEVLVCPDQSISGWQSHMQGCAKLFELKGPSAFQSDFGYGLYLSWRAMEVQKALNEHRHTYLSSDEWMHVPFKGRIKTTMHKFIDIMSALPGVIADGHNLLAPGNVMVSDPSQILLGVMALLDQAWKLDARLRKFYAELEVDAIGPIHWPKLTTWDDIETEDPILGRVFPVAFHFVSLETAHLCLLYWASTAILWSGMVYAYKILEGFKLDSYLARLPPLEHRSHVASLARNICQSVEYVNQETHRAHGKATAVFPLKVAIETLTDFPGCERELEWSLKAMEVISGSGGVALMRHLPVPMTDHGYLPG